jgi:UDP-N-acetylmuramate: L-alanyl-gamma-D-glutamyl-meso-diaminopimelate ligase
MRMGVNRDALRRALSTADEAIVYQSPGMKWNASELDSPSVVVLDDTDEIIERVRRTSLPGDRVVVMSNGGFEDLVRRLVSRLAH